MAMSPRLLRPVATGFHPEANAWRTAVVAAGGGTPSAKTMRAVSTLCADIDKAGIRDRFYRLGILAGPSLTAARVPLYRGQSATGTQYGDTTDTNVNFVSGDYSEAVGLNANSTPSTTTKYLDTGLSPDGMPTLATGHASVFKGAGSSGAFLNCAMIGSRTATQFYYMRQIVSTDVLSADWGYGSMTAGTTGRNAVGLALFSRTASNAMNGYFNTTSDLSNTSNASPAANANAFVVFNFRQTNGTVSTSGGWPHVISAYSIGAGMSSSQVSSFHTALTTFLAALGRPTA